MKKHYIIRKRRNQTATAANYKYKDKKHMEHRQHTQHGGLLPTAAAAATISKVAEKASEAVVDTAATAKDVLSKNKSLTNIAPLQKTNKSNNYNSSSQYTNIDPSLLYQIHGNPFKLNTLWDLAVQPITKIISELYVILKTGSITNPNELQAKLDTMANEIEDPDVKSLVLNYNSQIMNVYLNSINPSINIINKTSSLPISEIITNLIKNTYIYLIDNIKMSIINKQTNIVNSILNTSARMGYGLEFLNNNLINDKTNNLNNEFKTATFIQKGGNIDKNNYETDKTNEKLYDEIVTEINKSLRDLHN